MKISLQFAVPVTLMVGWLSLMQTAGCGQTGAQSTTQPQPQALATVSMPIGSKTFTLQKATTEPTRNIGLMYRDSMPEDHGMIFAFAEEQMLSFWMKNTRIPLQILYLDKDGKIVAIRLMRPFDLTGIDSGKPAKYAIELNPGVAEAAGVKVGDTIKIPSEVSADR